MFMLTITKEPIPELTEKQKKEYLDIASEIYDETLVAIMADHIAQTRPLGIRLDGETYHLTWVYMYGHHYQNPGLLDEENQTLIHCLIYIPANTSKEAADVVSAVLPYIKSATGNVPVVMQSCTRTDDHRTYLQVVADGTARQIATCVASMPLIMAVLIATDHTTVTASDLGRSFATVSFIYTIAMSHNQMNFDFAIHRITKGHISDFVKLHALPAKPIKSKLDIYHDAFTKTIH